MKAVYTAIAVLGFGFFIWLLLNMATGTDEAPAFLTSLGLAFVLVLVAMGAAAMMGRRDDDDTEHSAR